MSWPRHLRVIDSFLDAFRAVRRQQRVRAYADEIGERLERVHVAESERFLGALLYSESALHLARALATVRREKLAAGEIATLVRIAKVGQEILGRVPEAKPDDPPAHEGPRWN